MTSVKSKRTLQKERQPISWTRFYLLHGQDWLEWPTSYPNRYRGPLADVKDLVAKRIIREG
ncbi:hypothetical protein F4823DRAFT_607539 [Ustulina deusta]|nr:hypothetical protein F4823DRAFT_607539 [Ustulina deusta]